MAKTSAGPESEKGLQRLYSRIITDDVCREASAVQILHRVGDRWSSLILLILANGKFRHSELRRIINFLAESGSETPISQRVLTQKLRMLERDGLATRTVWPSVPPRAEYALTPLGHQLAEWIDGLVQWCAENRIAIGRAHLEYAKTQ